MNLPEYIKKLGDDEEAAKKLGEKPRTVASWRRRERYPRLKTAEKIIRRSNGSLDYAGIYGKAA